MAFSMPISYPSLKAIIENVCMEKREDIARHCPTTRQVESLIPYHLDHLCLSEVCVTVDSRFWLFRTHREYVGGGGGARPPSPYLGRSPGYFEQDPSELRENVLYPGDIVIELPPAEDSTRQEIAVENVLDQLNLNRPLRALGQGQELAAALARVNFDAAAAEERPAGPGPVLLPARGPIGVPLRLMGPDMDRIPPHVPAIAFMPFLARARARALPEPAQNVQEQEAPQISYQQEVHYNSHGDTRPEAVEQRFRFPLGVKKRDVMKALTAHYLGRRGTIRVRHLKLSQSNGVCRLPPGLRLQVRELTLTVNGDGILDAFDSVLDKRSMPLDKVSIWVHFPDDPEFRNPWITSAKRLCVTKPSQRIERVQFLPAILELRNQAVHLEFKNFAKDDVLALARRWLRDNRPLGSLFTLALTDLRFATDTFDLLADRLNAVVGELENRPPEYRKCVILPMEDGNELNVSANAAANPRVRFLWDLRMEVVPRGKK
ncbi:unnamed protein product [Caenorhabditis sp. 36 PRJEB53466]|nr:unnamed protein product [Caenorhabditis sp. 36 PRJEB53466]